MRLLLLLLLASPLAAAPVDQTVAFGHLLQFEGWKLRPYRDGPGWSVGLGHSLTSHHEPVKKTYTDAECRALYAADFQSAIRGCRIAFKGFDDLPAEVQLAILNVAWTCGPTGLMRFTNLRFAVAHRAWSVAAVEVAQSKWARQVSPDRRLAVIQAFQRQ